MVIVAGIVLYVAAVVCLCALAGASRKKQERCLRHLRERKGEAFTAEAASPSSKDLVAIRLQGVRRA